MADAWVPLLDLSVPLRGLLAVCTLALVTFIILQVLLVSPPWNRRVVGEIVLLVLALILAAVDSIAGTEPDFQKLLSGIALFFLLLGLARCAFILIFHGLLHFLHRDVPRIFLDIIQTVLYLAAFLIVLLVTEANPLSILTG